LEKLAVCPFLDESDPRCAVHLSLRRLDEALGLCAHRHEDCPIYREKLAGDAPPDRKPVKAVYAAG